VIDALIDARPEMPGGLRDRQMDAWEPLFAIADMARGDWLARARAASLALTPALKDGGAVGLRLLHDIREVVRAGGERVHLKELAWRLNAIEDAGWGGWNDGNGITSREIARHLRPFDLETEQLKIDGVNGRGDDVAAFGDAVERYPTVPGNPDTPNSQLLGYPAGQGHYFPATEGGENPPNTASDQVGNRVTERIATLSYPADPYASEGNGAPGPTRSPSPVGSGSSATPARRPRPTRTPRSSCSCARSARPRSTPRSSSSATGTPTSTPRPGPGAKPRPTRGRGCDERGGFSQN
jgi:Protein of unknown function (DUF3631)